MSSTVAIGLTNEPDKQPVTVQDSPEAKIRKFPTALLVSDTPTENASLPGFAETPLSNVPGKMQPARITPCSETSPVTRTSPVRHDPYAWTSSKWGDTTASFTAKVRCKLSEASPPPKSPPPVYAGIPAVLERCEQTAEKKARRIKALKEQLEAKEAKELTFQPQINETYNAARVHTPLIDRILEAEVRRRIEAQSLREAQLQRELSHVTFMPEISQYAASLTSETPVYDRLFVDGAERKERIKNLKKKVETERLRQVHFHQPVVDFDSPSERLKRQKGGCSDDTVMLPASDDTFAMRFPIAAERRNVALAAAAGDVFISLYQEAAIREEMRQEQLETAEITAKEIASRGLSLTTTPYVPSRKMRRKQLQEEMQAAINVALGVHDPNSVHIPPYLLKRAKQQVERVTREKAQQRFAEPGTKAKASLARAILQQEKRSRISRIATKTIRAALRHVVADPEEMPPENQTISEARKVSSADVESFCNRIKQNDMKLQEKLEKQRLDKAAREISEVTFKPKLGELPKYLKKIMAEKSAAEHARRAMAATSSSRRKSIEHVEVLQLDGVGDDTGRVADTTRNWSQGLRSESPPKTGRRQSHSTPMGDPAHSSSASTATKPQYIPRAVTTPTTPAPVITDQAPRAMASGQLDNLVRGFRRHSVDFTPAEVKSEGQLQVEIQTLRRFEQAPSAQLGENPFLTPTLSHFSNLFDRSPSFVGRPADVTIDGVTSPSSPAKVRMTSPKPKHTPRGYTEALEHASRMLAARQTHQELAKRVAPRGVLTEDPMNFDGTVKAQAATPDKRVTKGAGTPVQHAMSGIRRMDTSTPKRGRSRSSSEQRAAASRLSKGLSVERTQRRTTPNADLCPPLHDTVDLDEAPESCVNDASIVVEPAEHAHVESRNDAINPLKTAVSPELDRLMASLLKAESITPDSFPISGAPLSAMSPTVQHIIRSSLPATSADYGLSADYRRLILSPSTPTRNDGTMPSPASSHVPIRRFDSITESKLDPLLHQPIPITDSPLQQYIQQRPLETEGSKEQSPHIVDTASVEQIAPRAAQRPTAHAKQPPLNPLQRVMQAMSPQNSMPRVVEEINRESSATTQADTPLRHDDVHALPSSLDGPKKQVLNLEFALSPTVKVKVPVYEGDSPSTVAHSFMQQYGLTENPAIEPLIAGLVAQSLGSSR